jgi:hypothetical protein
MKKHEETMPDYIKSQRDVLTGIDTLGVLNPDVIKALDVEDVVMVIVIDKKNRKHLRRTVPTEALRNEHDDSTGPTEIGTLFQDPPDSGCWRIVKCDKGSGDKPHIVYARFCGPCHPTVIDTTLPCGGGKASKKDPHA